MSVTRSVSQNTETHPSARPAAGGFPTRRLLTVTPLVLVAVGGTVAGVLTRTPEGHVSPNIRVAGLALGGKSQEEARKALATHLAHYEQTRLALSFSSETGITRVWRSTARDLGLTVDTEATLQNVEKIAPPNAFQRLASFVSRAKPQDVAPVVSVENKKLRAVLAQIGATVNRKPRNARLTLTKGGFSLNRDKPGFAIDVKGSAEAVETAWQQFLSVDATTETPSTSGETPVTPPTEPPPGTETTQPKPDKPATPKMVEATLVGKITQAAITADALKEINGTLAAYSTHYSGSANRGGNIVIAANKINGTLLAPGEVFSYNDIVGPRTARHGFRLAPVIVNNQLVPGIGGGICQVSSTLYNAVLFADLKIVRRSHHAFPVHYLPAGRDATVAYGAVDFQFQNSTDAPIYVAAKASGGKISFRLLGKTTPGKKVSLATSGGWNRKGGRTATVTRIVRENGQIVRRERISNDYYNPAPAKKPVVRKKAAKRTTAPAAKPRTTPAPSTTPANTGTPSATGENAVP